MAIELPRRRPPSDLQPSRAALDLVRVLEGFRSAAYPDPASPRARTGLGSGDPWTLGYGHTAGVREGDTCMLAEADDLLSADLQIAALRVRDEIKEPLTQGEFDALTCMAFNLNGGIPRSVRACINGGTTDKGVVMPPGSYAAALEQFPRNCRAGGVPMRGLLRRRLAEACIASNLPWESACSINLIRLTVNEDKSIDWSDSTTLEDTLMRARQDVPLSPTASVTIITDKPKAAPVSEEIPAKRAEQGESPKINATPPSEPLQREEAKPAVPVPPAPQPAPVSPQPAHVTPPNVATPWGNLPTDPKAWFRSQEVWGGIMRIFSRLGGRGIAIKGGVGSVFLLISKGASDPVIASMAITLLVVCGFMVTEHWGEILAHFGRKKAPHEFLKRG